MLIVHLTNQSKLERARTSIRNFVADHLSGRDGKDAALVAFVAASYGVALFAFGSHRSGDDFADLKRVIQILGLFGVILSAVLCWFTFLAGGATFSGGHRSADFQICCIAGFQTCKVSW